MFPRFAWIAVAVALLLLIVLGGARLGPRLQAERDHRNLAILLDYQQLLTLAQDEGFPIEDYLLELKGLGFDHVALNEDTPLWLEQRGFCTVLQGFEVIKSVPEDDALSAAGRPALMTPEQIQAEKAKEKPEIDYVPAEKGANALLDLSPEDLHLLFPRDGGRGNILATVIAGKAAERLGEARVTLADRPEAGFTVVTLRGNPEDLADLGLGFSSPTARRLKQEGFAVVPRLRNQRSLPSAGLITALIAEAKRAADPGPRLLIGAGDEILGFPKAIPATADELGRQGLLFGLVEFAKQSGDMSLADKLVPRVVRVHSISDEEMEIYTPERAIPRYLLAARERNVRVIYLKPFLMDQQGLDLRQFNTDYFLGVKSGLEDLGFALSTTNNGTITNALEPWPTFGGDGPLAPPSRLWGLLALAVAFTFPLIALYLLTSALPAMLDRADRGETWPMVAVSLLWLWGWALMAALIQAALLSEPHYLLQVRSFSGVKLALLGPVLLAAVLWVRVLVDNPPRRLTDQAVLLGNFPIQVKHLVVGGIVLLAAMVILLRSGNEPVGGISPIELAFRAALGELLDIRPRTKEFLLGHPSLVLGLYLLFQRHRWARPWAFPFLVAGTLGFTSFINTFQHFHTPLAVSMQRTLMAMLIGTIIGLVLVVFVAGLIHVLSRGARGGTQLEPAPPGDTP